MGVDRISCSRLLLALLSWICAFLPCLSHAAYLAPPQTMPPAGSPVVGRGAPSTTTAGPKHLATSSEPLGRVRDVRVHEESVMPSSAKWLAGVDKWRDAQEHTTACGSTPHAHTHTNTHTHAHKHVCDDCLVKSAVKPTRGAQYALPVLQNDEKESPLSDSLMHWSSTEPKQAPSVQHHAGAATPEGSSRPHLKGAPDPSSSRESVASSKSKSHSRDRDKERMRNEVLDLRTTLQVWSVY